jgi:hypothetical protein
VTDPDKRDITDQRYVSDAELRYQAGTLRPRTHSEWLAYFGEHYGDRYKVVAPSAPGGRWQATAWSGQPEQLFSWSPTELLDELIERRSRSDRTAMRQNTLDPHHHRPGMSRPFVMGRPPKRPPADWRCSSVSARSHSPAGGSTLESC